MILLMLVGSYANAATVLVGNGIEWTSTVTGVGTAEGTITLKADVSGASFGWGDVGYLSGIGIKDIAGSGGGDFSIGSLNLTNWSANNYELNSGAAGACQTATGTSNRACAYADSSGDRIASDGPNLEIILGVALASGVLTDTFHLKVLWENNDGSKTGDLISNDLSTVPLPAAAWLFGSALVGMVVVARRRDLRNRTPVA